MRHFRTEAICLVLSILFVTTGVAKLTSPSVAVAMSKHGVPDVIRIASGILQVGGAGLSLWPAAAFPAVLLVGAGTAGTLATYLALGHSISILAALIAFLMLGLVAFDRRKDVRQTQKLLEIADRFAERELAARESGNTHSWM